MSGIRADRRYMTALAAANSLVWWFVAYESAAGQLGFG
jgi:hypothetical protein